MNRMQSFNMPISFVMLNMIARMNTGHTYFAVEKCQKVQEIPCYTYPWTKKLCKMELIFNSKGPKGA